MKKKPTRPLGGTFNGDYIATMASHEERCQHMGLPSRQPTSAPVTAEFDFGAVERNVDGPPPSDDLDYRALSAALRSVADWLLTGESGGTKINVRAAKTRLIALGWYLQLPAFRHANVTKLAGDFGLTSAGISKYIRALNRHFGVYAAGQKQSMRRRDRTKTTGHTPSPLKGIGDPGLN